MEPRKKYIYEEAAVSKAVVTMIAPAILSQLISLVYNMADTFFVGQLGDPNQVAAVSISAPIMLVLTALANLFGIGGAGTLSRFLGKGDEDGVRKAAAFGVYGALATAVILSLLAAVFHTFVAVLLGSDEYTVAFTKSYTFWTFILGGVPTMMNLTLAHFIRADGAAKQAGFALSAGGVLNMLLDPVFIFDWGLNLGVTGAAIATFISNVAVLLYFVFSLVKNRATSAVTPIPRHFTFARDISLGVIGTGMPGMLQTLLASVSNTVLNQLAKPFGSAAISAFGIAKKLDQIPMSITIGMSQGIVPLMGYSHSAGRPERTRRVLGFTVLLAMGFSVLCVVVYEIFAGPLVRLFLDEPGTVSYGVYFLRVMCVSTPLMAAGFLMITLFQATGASRPALILSVLRKGLVDIPLMLLMNLFIPLYGLSYVQPMTEFIAMAAAVVLYLRFARGGAAVPPNNTGR
ncbi:MAG: MATE family efflux transporter [Synergistaceae bacterium]|jgi:putative MATE family efflux protein|nr:MATE family efflux transporter [Synergistaceae bacterium]